MSKDENDGGVHGIVLQGIGVSPGVVVGPAFHVVDVGVHVPDRSIGDDDVSHEIVRFEEALIVTRSQIREIQRNLESHDSGEAGVLDAHLLVLDDRSLIEDVIRQVSERRKNVELMVKAVVDRHVEALSAMDDDYLRERVADIRDVFRRLLRNLSGESGSFVETLDSKHIVMARDLAPSETASLRRDLVAGFAIDLGSPTSHTAVLARALEIPAIVALHDASEKIHTGDEILMDGNKGILIIRPTESQLDEYGKLAETRRTIEATLSSLKEKAAETADGHRLILSANVEGRDELDAVLHYGAEGVGLFRTEYLYMSKHGIVPEQEQTEVYSEVAERLAPQPVIIRTLDIGGDKVAFGERTEREANPFLGCRSIRLSLQHPGEFKAQLRAILRASRFGNVKLMYPMISNLREVLRANELLEEARQELDREGAEYDHDMDVGVMIEIPSAAMVADILARHVKFFSIGTNDLIQYTLAVDRVNERVAYLYEPTHPAVIRLLRWIVDAGHKEGIWVGLCGEMAADPLLTPLLVGLDMDELSVAPSAVPLVKDVIRNIQYADARALADRCVACESADEVLREGREMLMSAAPEILELI